MKLVFFSDAHGNQYSLKSFFESMNRLKPDLMVFGGDALGYYYGANEVIDLLRNHRVVCLQGNHDRLFLDLIEGKISEASLIERYGNSYKGISNVISKENVDFLRATHLRLSLDIDGWSLVFVHGSVSDPLNGRVYPDDSSNVFSEVADVDVVFLGHTHHKMIKYFHGFTVVNPGSIGQQRDGFGCSYVTFDTSSGELRFDTVEYDINKLVCEINRHNETSIARKRLTEVLFRKNRIPFEQKAWANCVVLAKRGQ